MARYRVVKDGTGWAVTKNGTRHFQKTYPTKQKATNAATRAANKGDSVQGQKVTGEWGRENTKGIFGPDGDSA